MERGAYDAVLRSPVPRCWLGIRVGSGGVEALDWLPAGPPDGPAGATPERRPLEEFPAGFLEGATAGRRGAADLVAETVRQLQAYFHDPRHAFTLPLVRRGSPFQQRVWRALRTIPPGETRRYGELARSLGTAPRAVGAACRCNPWPIVVPCHRVVAAAGSGGYCGARDGPWLAVKHWLLTHEQGVVRETG